MERTVALKKIGKLLGKNFGWRMNSKAPTPEERVQAKDALPAARELYKTLADKKRARYEAVLAADAEYQELFEQCRVALRNRNDLEGKLHSYKITVGNSVAGLFFSVKAEGDSWEEVLAKLTVKAAA